ncbi:hypothetical protein HYU95_03430 [Candidatus Daviesbacteria bacterium]|nr:hypothetical protein [Candidatus Daviesbacteria bacterium]
MPPAEPDKLNNSSDLPKNKLGLKHLKIVLILILISLIPFFIYLTQLLLYKFDSRYTQYTSQKQQEENRKKQEEDYQNLLNKQTERSRQAKIESKEAERKATGIFNLRFVFVKPLSLSQSTIAPLINKLQEKNNQEYTSLLYLNTFYTREAARYGMKNFAVEISFEGVYNLPALEKIGDMAYIWNKDPFGTVKLQDSFRQLLKNPDAKPDKSDLVVFLYFDDSFGQNDPNAEDRFYEYKKFRSFANESDGKAYINVYSFNPAFAENVTEIAAHEVLHLFGATDKYEESESVKRVCSERGRGDPDLKPAVPQQTTDILCMYIETENDQFIRGHFSKKNMVINRVTAKEIGWIQ